MSDPYGWLQQVEAPSTAGRYDWLDDKPESAMAKKPKDTLNIDFTQSNKKVRAAISLLPKDQRDVAMQRWADVYVAKEREAGKGSIGQYVGDTVRNLARGTPVGSFLDEANAATASLFGGSYDESLAYQRAMDRAVDLESTKLGKLPVIGDVTVGGATKLAGGIASAPITPIVNAMRGSALLPRMVNGLASGAIYGSAYGAGLGEGQEDRAIKGAVGAAVGGVGGAAIPAVAAGASRASELVRSAAPTPRALREFDPRAVAAVRRALENDLSTTVPGRTPTTAYGLRAGQLGDEGMLADMGPNMQNQAGAIASMPGPGMARVNRSLRSRAAGAQGRINRDVDAALGPRVNIVDAEQTAIRNAAQAARPMYQQFETTTIPLNTQIQSAIRRASHLPGNILDKAERAIRARGSNPTMARFLDEVKKAVDDVASAADRAGKRNLSSTASQIARDLRSGIDEGLSPGNPQQSIYAQARRASGDGFQFSEGLEAGQKAFAKDLSPDQMRADLSNMVPIQRNAYQAGARSQIRDVMGNASTKFGENSAAKGRALLGSDHARGKLNLLTTPDRSRQLVRRLDAESDFDATYQNVLQNSKTAIRQAAQKEFPPPSDGSGAANELGKKTVAGLSMEMGYRALNGLLNGALNERRIAVARDAAEILVSQGGSRNRIASGLLMQARRAGVAQQRREALERLAEMVMRGSQPVGVSEVVE